ncbi:MAG: 50S ribosome-binding GTPase, partial [Chlorobiales bacterium]|nr:50S ribosome-binding GTPase [Chlorobiales bacterium]
MSESSSRVPEITVALAGQPNTGKSTVFNFLTGSNQHVGNWPGITVEQKEGRFIRDGISYRVVDLPGTYSLSANSKEEMIARDFVIKQAPDLVVVVVDASQLTRSLYLVAEMMSLGTPMIVALNMMDVAAKKGFVIDLGAFEKSIGVPVVPMTASKRVGIDALSESIAKTASIRNPVSEACCNPDGEYADLLQRLQDTIKGYVPEDYRVEWVAQKLLEEDSGMIDLMQKQMGGQQWRSLRKMLPDDNRGAFAVARARYDWIQNIVANSVMREKNEVHRSLFDKVAT